MSWCYRVDDVFLAVFGDFYFQSGNRQEWFLSPVAIVFTSRRQFLFS